MIGEAELLAAVDEAFVWTSRHLEAWPDPHSDRDPADVEYSRVTNAARYRILGARADAWVAALLDLGLATRRDQIEWVEPPRAVLTRRLLILPNAPGALAIAVARLEIGDCDDAGLTLGVGDPSTQIAFFPDCGCDACDSGSQNEIDVVDDHLHAIITGEYRRLSCGNRLITMMRDSLSTTNIAPRTAEAVLANHEGWAEITGAPWIGLPDRPSAGLEDHPS